MAFDPFNLSAVSYANGFSLWHYKTSDTWAEILRPNYFDQFPHLCVGDLVVVNAAIHMRTMTGVLVVVSVMPRDIVVGELVAPVSYGASVTEAAE